MTLDDKCPTPNEFQILGSAGVTLKFDEPYDDLDLESFLRYLITDW